MLALDAGKKVISTHHDDVLCSQPRGTPGLAPCTHEEADSRMLLHLEDAVKEGYTKVVVRTVELAVTAAQRLDITELWVTFWNWEKSGI